MNTTTILIKSEEIVFSNYIRDIEFIHPGRPRTVLATEDKIIVLFFEVENSKLDNVSDCRTFYAHALSKLLKPTAEPCVKYESKTYAGISFPKPEHFSSFDVYFKTLFK